MLDTYHSLGTCDINGVGSISSGLRVFLNVGGEKRCLVTTYNPMNLGKLQTQLKILFQIPETVSLTLED